MCLFSKLKFGKEKDEEKRSVQVMLDFAEGRLSAIQFWKIYTCNESLRNTIINDKMRYSVTVYNPKTGKFNRKYDRRLKNPSDLPYNINPNNLLEKINILKLQDKYELFVVINRYLSGRDIKIEKYNEDVNKYLFLQNLLPDWVNVDNIEYLENIFMSASKDLNEKEKVVWCKMKIKELFRYDTKPPEWIQPPEWPIIDNVPYIFSHQEPKEEDSGYERYYFYDSQNREKQIVIEQYD